MPKSAIPTQKGGSGANIDTFTLPADPSVQFTPVLNTHRQKVIIGRENDADTTAGTGWIVRGCSASIPGRGGTTGQTLATIKKTISSVYLVISDITVDLYQTAALTTMVAPPKIEIHLQPDPTITGGTVRTPVVEAKNASSGMSARFDASADGVLSATPLTSSVAYTQSTTLIEAFSPRFLNSTTAGVRYEPADRMHLLQKGSIILDTSSNDGVAVFLNYTSAAQNPSTNFWCVTYRAYSQ